MGLRLYDSKELEPLFQHSEYTLRVFYPHRIHAFFRLLSARSRRPPLIISYFSSFASRSQRRHRLASRMAAASVNPNSPSEKFLSLRSTGMDGTLGLLR